MGNFSVFQAWICIVVWFSLLKTTTNPPYLFWMQVYLIFDDEIVSTRSHSTHFEFRQIRHDFSPFVHSNHFGIQKEWNDSEYAILHYFVSFYIILYHFMSIKFGNVPNILELDLNHFQKSWKNSKIFGIKSFFIF